MKRTELNSKIKETIKELRTLQSAKNKKSIMITSHNAILAIRSIWNYEDSSYNSNKITHIIDLSEERNLKNIESIDCHLSVPRYTPRDARNWLLEDTKFNNSDKNLTIAKTVLSEKDLRDLVINEKKSTLEYLLNLRKFSNETLARF
jgi:hypothetical protein